MKIVSVDDVYLHPNHIEELETLGEVVIYHDTPNEEVGINRIKDADVVIDNWLKMPKAVIRGAKKLKMITVAATGYEWIDLSETLKHNIVICNAPGYATEAVAEHTIGLMLQAIRQGSQAERDLRIGIWTPIKYEGEELQNKTLGIIGYGAIGRRVAAIAQKGFGMHILYTTSASTRNDFEHLLRESDIISINVPLTSVTKGIISAKEFRLMKQGVVIVNTGRGAVIDEEELINNLKSKKIFAGGLDVLTKEPLDQNNKLLNFPNVTLTPHIAWNTEESKYRLSQIVMENIKCFLVGTPQNVVS